MTKLAQFWISATFLIKAAGNRARELLRLGQLSSGAQNKLRRAGMLPSPAKMVSGLERGTSEMKRKYDIVEPPLNQWSADAIHEKYGPQAVTAPTATSLTVDLPRKLNPVTGQLVHERWMGDAYQTLPFQLGQHEAVKQIAPSLYGLQEQKALAAAVRRHEATEAMAGRQQLRQQSPTGLLPRAGDEIPNLRMRPGFFSHMSPGILVQEGRSLTGLPASVQRQFRSWRETPMPEMFGRDPFRARMMTMGGHDFSKTPTTTELTELRKAVSPKKLMTGIYRDK